MLPSCINSNMDIELKRFEGVFFQKCLVNLEGGLIGSLKKKYIYMFNVNKDINVYTMYE